MTNITLYPELIDYIYQFCDEFKTNDEKSAERTILYKSKNMIADGYESFKKKVAERICSQHKSELGLNLCPRCNKIARTPKAKQCRFCFYAWHNSIIEVR